MAPAGLGGTRKKGVGQGLSSTSRGVEDRHGHGDAFWDVVDGDGDGYRNAAGRIVHGRHEGGETFREVVDGDGQGGQHTEPQQALVAEAPARWRAQPLFQRDSLMGILRVWD